MVKNRQRPVNQLTTVNHQSFIMSKTYEKNNEIIWILNLIIMCFASTWTSRFVEEVTLDDLMSMTLTTYIRFLHSIDTWRRRSCIHCAPGFCFSFKSLIPSHSSPTSALWQRLRSTPQNGQARLSQKSLKLSSVVFRCCKRTILSRCDRE